jgi:hypothetical protein
MLSIALWRWYINITITILNIIHRPVLYLKHSLSETGFCLHLQVVHTQLSQIGRASLSLRFKNQSLDSAESGLFWCFHSDLQSLNYFIIRNKEECNFKSGHHIFSVNQGNLITATRPSGCTFHLYTVPCYSLTLQELMNYALLSSRNKKFAYKQKELTPGLLEDRLIYTSKPTYFFPLSLLRIPLEHTEAQCSHCVM